MQIQLPAGDILDFIQRNSDLFVPPYHERVDLKAYALKLEKYATHFIIRNRDEIAGLLACYLNDYQNKIGYVSYLCVDRTYQERGFGMELLEEAVDCARKLGFRQISLEVDKINEGARRFYKSAGFNREAAKPLSIVMTLDL